MPATTGTVTAIEPAALAAMLGSERLLIVQVTSPDVFNQAHVPGAQLVTPAELVSGERPATGRLPSPERLNDLFRRLGYARDLQIVVYDDEGGGWAGRFGWTLDVIGHDSWIYLNGGLHSWAAAGLPLASGPATPIVPAADLDLTIHREPIAEIADVLAAIDDPGQLVWDVRTREEYLGLKQASARAGHIPGAVNFDWMGLKDPARDNRLTEGIDADLAKLGIDGSKAMITHCQTHHRSGLSYLWGRLRGWPIRAYHGSWSEWGNEAETPIDNPAAAS